MLRNSEGSLKVSDPFRFRDHRKGRRSLRSSALFLLIRHFSGNLFCCMQIKKKGNGFSDPLPFFIHCAARTFLLIHCAARTFLLIHCAVSYFFYFIHCTVSAFRTVTAAATASVTAAVSSQSCVVTQNSGNAAEGVHELPAFVEVC